MAIFQFMIDRVFKKHVLITDKNDKTYSGLLVDHDTKWIVLSCRENDPIECLINIDHIKSIEEIK